MSGQPKIALLPLPQKVVGGRVQQPGARGEAAGDVPAALADGRLLGRAGLQRAPVHRLQVDLEADLL